MDNQDRVMKILKNIGGFAFAAALILAINIFAGVGREYLSRQIAMYLFIGFGGMGLLLNLVTFQTGKYHPVYNLIYWLGSIITFVGLISMLMRWPFGRYTMIFGMMTIGVSFFLPKRWVDPKGGNSDLLDD
ncbi:MAG: hypothetical protein Crog4KO_15440 [Crocinitomicaceae bacterium]